MNNKFFVSCGEMSGDLHLSYIINGMKKIDTKAEFYGVVGDKSIAEGAVALQHIKDNDIMGFTEIIKKYKYFKNKAVEYVEFIKKHNIKNIIFIDYGGFNIRFFELIKKETSDIRTFYYIPPKVWAWGEKRIEKLEKVDEIIVIFPWEKEFYDKKGVKANYFGNPFIDKYDFSEKFGKKILLLPGSRRQEIIKILPIMLDFVKENKNENFILKLADESHITYVEFDENEYSNLEISYDTLKNLREYSRLAIATSGTVTFETALMGLPVIVGYKTSFINEFIAKKILHIKYISLTNIGMKMEILPELLQKDFNTDKIKEKVNLIDNSKDSVIQLLLDSRNSMGKKGVIEQISKFILERAL
ncbi:MAG: lipid-A-disaccharide synthase [Sebaldella sp.]|nr:lipid-A-disaccharide synthase [Sebaldella sp.]